MASVLVQAVLLALLAGGCSRTLAVHAPAPGSRAGARACAALLQALPRRVAGQPTRRVDAGGGYAAAWGDPAIELRCGVPRPPGLDRFASCQVANGVGWFIPESEQTGHPVDVTMTTVGRAQTVQVLVPEAYFPPVNAMVDLAPALRRTIRQVRPCV